jgi:diguanylate cyclase (GGDEF)-like protein
MRNQISSYLKRFASPGFIPDSLAVFISYLIILVIFPLDVITGSQVSLNVIYVFPLTLIALHCTKIHLVSGALILSVIVQFLTLLTFHKDSVSVKILLFWIILLSDVTTVLIARYARFNILEAKRLSTTDPLTRLSNRRALEIAISAESTRQRRYGGVFCLVLIDLDGFKSVNDTKGHREGDNALILLANILRTHTRNSDLIFRIGGDEFVILMPNTEALDCSKLCNGLCKTIADEMLRSSFTITASIGYTTVENPPSISVDILTIADKAMYAAKSSGKSRVVRG